MTISKKKSKVTKINTRRVSLQVKEPSPDQSSVAALAYQFWLQEKCHGNDVKHWLQAEQLIKSAQE